MALLLTLILFLHIVGALLFIPSMVSLFRPRFAMAGVTAPTPVPVQEGKVSVS
jgi:hypothetical protein